MVKTKQDKTAELLMIADKGIKEFYQSDKFKSYLNTMQKFHKYSSRNIMLIMNQRPDASMVSGFKTWQKDFGRHVQKGEKGISIIAGRPFDKEVINKESGKKEKISGVTFFPTTVFDVKQTDGKPLPTLTTDLQGKVPNFEQLKEVLIKSTVAKVEFKETLDNVPDGTKGLFNHRDYTIQVRSTLPEEQQIKTLIHEMAHVNLHSPKDGLSAPVKEVQAESVAYVISNKLGIDSSNYSFPYLATWINGTETKDLMSQLETVRKGVDSLSNSIDKNLADLNKENDIARPLPINEQIKKAKDVSIEKNTGTESFKSLDIGQENNKKKTKYKAYEK